MENFIFCAVILLFLGRDWQDLSFNYLSYLIFQLPNNIQILVIISTYDVQLPNNIQILVIISTYGVQPSSLESDITSFNHHFHCISLIFIWIWINIIISVSKMEIAFFNSYRKFSFSVILYCMISMILIFRHYIRLSRTPHHYLLSVFLNFCI